MSTVKMCDVCGKVAEKMAVEVTEDKTKTKPPVRSGKRARFSATSKAEKNARPPSERVNG